MAYLDNDGLLHFWQSIKTKFATKAEVDERLNGYIKSADAYTKAQADAAIASAIDSKLAALDATASAY